MMIRPLCLFVLVFLLGACSLVPVVERLALFEADPPPKIGITDGTLAILPFSGPEEQAPALRREMGSFFKSVAPVGYETLWRGQPILEESRLFGEASVEQWRNLGVQWVLTGRYRPPPKGFLTLEVIQVGDQSPFWMFGIPWMTGEKEGDVARKALQKFAEKMGLEGRRIVFPILGTDGFYLPEVTPSVVGHSGMQPVVSASTVSPAPPPFVAQWTVEVWEQPLSKGTTQTTTQWIVDRDSSPEPVVPLVESVSLRNVPEVPFAARWEVEQVLPVVSKEMTDRAVPVPQPETERPDGHNRTVLLPKAEEGGSPSGNRRPESYVLQAGLYHDVKGALDMVQELRKRGYEPEIAEIAAHDGHPVVWRVWIGLYDHYNEARERAGVFLAKESLPVQVVLQSIPMALFRYAVQAGSFINPTNARELTVVLRQKGYQPTVQESRDAKDRVWHSVWVGCFWDMAQARQVARDFRDKEGIAPFVTTMDAWSSRQLLAKEVSFLRESSPPAPKMVSTEGVVTVETAATPDSVLPGGGKQSFNYAVQVGSYTDAGRAQAIVESLQGKGYRPQLMTQTDAQGRLWHMLWIGQFQGFSKARQLRDSYRSREGGPAFVTPIALM